MSNIYRKVCTGISFVKGRPVLDIFCRDFDNRRQVVKVFGLPCYFYVDVETHIEEEDMKEVLSEASGYTSLFGQQLKKITVKKISTIKKMGQAYKGLESDVKWDKKALLDLQITDKFVGENGKAYTLDPRFNAINEVETDIVTPDGVSVSTTVQSYGAKEIVNRAMDEEVLTQSNKPTFGHEPYEIRHAVVDIEVIVSNKEGLRTYEGDIVCVVIWDSYTDEYYKFKVNKEMHGVNAEKAMLKEVAEKFKELDVDIISGWNVQFDMLWLINKWIDYSIDLSVYFPGGETWITKYTDQAGKFHEKIYLGGRMIVDGMELYKKKTMTTEKLNSYSLKSVAVVEGFPEWEDLGRKVKELWDTESDKIVEYCRIDVERTMQIIVKKQLLIGAHTTCKFFGCGFDETNTNSRVIESMMFLLRNGRILPNLVRGRDKAEVKGAVVLDNTAGMHHNVGIFDAASLYPSIIMGLNISPECVVKEDDFRDSYTVKAGENTHHFLKQEIKMGLMTEVIAEMRKLREQIRSNRQAATARGDTDAFELYNNEEKVAKGVLASVYGVMGFKDFRLFNEDCANAITAVGRGMIDKIKNTLNTGEFSVIYGDTDSVFIKTQGLDSGIKAQKMINDIMPAYLETFGVKDPVIAINFEKLFKWMLFIKRVTPKRKGKFWKKDTGAAKKTYIGFISHKEGANGEMKAVSELYYRGIALRRSDSAIVLKDTMKRFFTLMEDGTFLRSIELLKDVHKTFKNYDKKFLAMPRSVNEEDANNPWANGMRYAKANLGFEFNDDELPKLLYVKNQYKYPKTNVICYQDGHTIPPEFEVDYDIMFNKLIRAKFEPIVESLGLAWDIQIGNQSSLDQWV